MRLRRTPGAGPWQPRRRWPPRVLPPDRDAVGHAAEQVAVDHLVKQGFSIVARNWADARGELDIIARRRDLLVVVEVRALRDAGVVTPEQTVTRRKQRRVYDTARRWLAGPGSNVAESCYIRFDVIGVLVPPAKTRASVGPEAGAGGGDGRGFALTHIEGAFSQTDLVRAF